ncbi:cupin domain-containing protein [Anaeromyxobacter oryzae]|uniref:XRE family transcriptional regulator n=1 Tax=Anaeromyxobacter oryzae TaxID=2918170 RepID=A0ABM7WSU0_9BACT|nr:cupin domain-containing protein [Anaeromyxobacter oryzae]BDG02485.1 XRE family transcriptional regulator [Anaeromyxobacter oryzae]
MPSRKRHAPSPAPPRAAPAQAPTAAAPASLGEFDIGERLREIRERYGLSQRALAMRADVTNGMISMIEKNRSSPSIATLKKILGGFPMSLADFFAVGQPEQPKIFFGADELVEIAGGPISYRQVGANLQGRALQVIHERLMPGADTGSEMLRHEAEEGGIVIRGEMELTVGMSTRVLRAGDAYYFDSRIPHRFRNLGEEPCEIVSACTPPSF